MTDRLLPTLLRSICENRGIRLESLSSDWLFELVKDGRVVHILGYTFGLNSAVSAKIARDKVATYELLKYYTIPAIEHRLVRMANSDWRQWQWSVGRVMKPLQGGSGSDIGVVRSSDAAADWMNTHEGDAWAVAPLLDIAREVRIVVLDGQIMVAYEKVPVVVGGLKMFNLGLGATPQNIDLSPEVSDLAKNAMQAARLRLAAVDIIELPTGEWQVLEINEAFAMNNYAKFSPANMQKTEALYDAIVAAMFA